MFHVEKMTELLVLFDLEQTIGAFYRDVSQEHLIENKYYQSNTRPGIEALISQCIESKYNLGVYTSLKENDAMNVIDLLFSQSVDLKYILTQEHCKKVGNNYIKCLNHIDTRRYQPILITTRSHLVDSDLKKYTIKIPLINSDDIIGFNIYDVYPVLKRIYESKDKETTIKIIHDWNQRKDDLCIIL